MPNENKTNYLAKLLTLLVKRENGVIRIPIGDLMVDDVGQGIQVHFSQDTKELVLSHVPAGSTIYRIEGQTTWLTNQLIPQARQEQSPRSTEELVAKAWTETAATPTNAEVAHPPKRPTVIRLTDESMALAEAERLKQAALREIENYQSPQPRTTPSRPLTAFYKK